MLAGSVRLCSRGSHGGCPGHTGLSFGAFIKYPKVDGSFKYRGIEITTPDHAIPERIGLERCYEMARICEICGKGPRSGNRVSHAHNKTRMRQLPNLQTVHIHESGRKMTRRVCTQCIKSGRISKSA